MADIFGYNEQFTVQPGVWFLAGDLTISADGYTVSSSLPRGVAGLTHNGTGDFTLVLTDCWFDLLHACINTKNSGGEIRLVQLKSDTVGDSAVAAGSQGIRFLTVTDAGSSTDMPSGGIISFCLVLQNTSTA